MQAIHFQRLAIYLVLPQLAGVLGSFFTMSAVDGWYAGLNKPAFNPPNWIFGPVWITLYLLMGISAYLIWRTNKNKSKNQSPVRSALAIFWIQLLFNALWSWLFFGLSNPGLALLDLIALWLLILVLIVKTWPLNRWAGSLLIPYVAWVSFAGVLNYFIWHLN